MDAEEIGAAAPFTYMLNRMVRKMRKGKGSSAFQNASIKLMEAFLQEPKCQDLTVAGQTLSRPTRMTLRAFGASLSY